MRRVHTGRPADQFRTPWFSTLGFDIALSRNPQYRLDQSPTTPKVFLIETRQVEEPFEDEPWNEGDEEYLPMELA